MSQSCRAQMARASATTGRRPHVEIFRREARFEQFQVGDDVIDNQYASGHDLRFLNA